MSICLNADLLFDDNRNKNDDDDDNSGYGEKLTQYGKQPTMPRGKNMDGPAYCNNANKMLVKFEGRNHR